MASSPIITSGASCAALAFDAVEEHAVLAARFAQAAANLAAAQDGPGMAHALGCASRAVLAAGEAAATLRPQQQGGGAR